MDERLRQVEMDVAKHEERFSHLGDAISELSTTIKQMAKTITELQVRFAIIIGGIMVLQNFLPVLKDLWRP